MRKSLLFAVLGLCAIVAASAQVTSTGRPLDEALAQAQVEARAADNEVRRLSAVAAQARTRAAKLAAEQLAAAQAIAAAEARISAADAELRLISARQSALTRHLQEQQQPISSLLTGLAMMASRPPLVSLASAGGTEELVRIRILVDSTLPVIRARTASVRDQLTTLERLQQTAATAKGRLETSRQELAAKRAEFAKLEERALAEAAASDTRALVAGDTALAASDTAAALSSRTQQARTSANIAALLAREPTPPPAPGPSSDDRTQGAAPFPYRLPSQAPVLAGMGAISASGVRSRGITLGTTRGSTVATPASGIIRFAGPYEEFDGVVIIDHGSGWISLIVNVATQLKQAERVELGDPLGRALGPIEVELLHRGQRLSPALMSGSSQPLSNKG